MKKGVKILLMSLLIFGGSLYASFDFNSNMKKAYDLSSKLRFKEADSVLNSEVKINPNNSVIQYNKTRILLYKCLIAETEKSINEFNKQYSLTLKTFEDDNHKSPFKKYLHSEILLFRAIINAKNSSYIKALFDIKNSYQLIVENKKEYKHFLPNNKIDAVMNIGFGSVPDSFTWLLKIFNIDASVNKGISELENLIEQTSQIKAINYLNNEIVFIYVYAKTNLGSKDKTFIDRLFKKEFINNQIKENPLLTMAKTSYLQKQKRNDDAIICLNSLEETTAYKLHYLEIMRGESYLYKLNPDAEVYFKSYLKNFPGKSFVKTAYQKIAWIKSLENNKKGYFYYLDKINENGELFIDSDKQAQKEFEEYKLPNGRLLSARLLFDGGYYEQALQQLDIENPQSVFNDAEYLEFLYRKGRIYDSWGNENKALVFYKKTMKIGEDSKHYYPANSALHSGYIYENSGESEKAIEMFEKCLDFDFEEYRNSITQKAKAGINRLEK